MADLSTQGRGLSRAQRTRGPLVLVVTTLVSLIGGVSPDGDALAGRPIGDTVVFASVPDPGRCESIAIGDGVVYVGTHTGAMGNAGEGPSKVFTYDLRSGERTGEILIEGQNLHATRGILAMTFGPDGRLYVVDRNPPRLIAIDLSADPPTQSTYATFPELHSCNSTPCPPGALDEPSFPDGVVFDPAGNAYVTDVQTGTIFRVPPDGGLGQIWFQDARIDGVFGPNGITLDPTGTKLFFAVSSSSSPTAPGSVYSLPVVAQPRADELARFHDYVEPGAIPDGLIFGRSGKLYVTLGGANQISVLDSHGVEVVRFPSAPDNHLREVPYDNPANVDFTGSGSLLVTNQSFFSGNPKHWVVLDVWVDDVGVSRGAG